MICVMMATSNTDNIIDTKTYLIIGKMMVEAGHSGNQYQKSDNRSDYYVNQLFHVNQVQR